MNFTAAAVFWTGSALVLIHRLIAGPASGYFSDDEKNHLKRNYPDVADRLAAYQGSAFRES